MRQTPRTVASFIWRSKKEKNLVRIASFTSFIFLLSVTIKKKKFRRWRLSEKRLHNTFCTIYCQLHRQCALTKFLYFPSVQVLGICWLGRRYLKQIAQKPVKRGTQDRDLMQRVNNVSQKMSRIKLKSSYEIQKNRGNVSVVFSFTNRDTLKN